MTKANLRLHRTPKFKPGQHYRGVQGKIVEWVAHTFEEGLLYIHVRFTDKTELCWRVSSRMTIDEADWTFGDYKQLRVFVRNECDST